MIFYAIVFAVGWLIATPATAQNGLPFSTSAHAYRLWGGCIGLKLTLLTRSQNGNPSDWKSLVLTVANRVAAKIKIDSIEIDLRRGDESSRPRDESGLAYLLSDVTPTCSQPMSRFLRVASRLLTERELKIRDVYLTLAASGIPEDRVEKVVAREFKLPRSFLLPSSGMSNDYDFTPSQQFINVGDLHLAIDASIEAIKRLP